MKRWSPGHAASATLVAGALALVPAASAHGQVLPDRAEQRECRCVDPDGQEIESCTCVRMPDVDGIVARIMPLMGRARLGVTLSDSDGEDQGARVESVMEGGPAEEAGIREGDVIIRIDGQSLLEPLEAADEEHFDLDRSLPVQRLVVLARRLEPGDEVEVEYRRDGEAHTTTLTARDLPRVGIISPRLDAEGMAIRMRDLGDRVRELHIRRPEELGVTVWSQPDEGWTVLPRERGFVTAFGGRRSWECPGDPEEQAFLTFSNRCVGGLELLELKPGLADYFGTSRGVLVSDVHEDSTLGLEPGDVILDIDGREATDPAQVRRILLSYEDHEEITLRIMRRQNEMSIQGTLRG